MIYYYTYKITCLKGSLKNHYYFGQHRTENLNDGYCGSGTLIQDYYKKYGAIENVTYIKEILNFYSNINELNNAEFNLIGDKYENDELCINLRTGGNVHTLSIESKNKISEANTGKKHPFSQEHKNKISEALNGKNKTTEHCKHISEALKGKGKGRLSPMKGKHQTEEAKQKISEKNKGNKNTLGHRLTNEHKLKISNSLKGRLSPMKGKHISNENKILFSKKYKGTIFIHLGDNIKRVEKEHVFYWLDDGWKLGQKDKNIKNK